MTATKQVGNQRYVDKVSGKEFESPSAILEDGKVTYVEMSESMLEAIGHSKSFHIEPVSENPKS